DRTVTGVQTCALPIFGGHPVARLIARLAIVGVALAPEIVVDVFLAGEPSVPRRDAAGAIVEHAEHAAAARIGLGLHALVTGGGRSEERRVGKEGERRG